MSLEQDRDAFVERLFLSCIGAMDVFTVYIGDRLGLYRTLSQHGPLTAPELAKRAGIQERYAREWLEQQAATAILEVDEATAAVDERRFSLPPAHAQALVDPESPYAMAALCRSILPLAVGAPSVIEAFRSGGGVAWDAFGEDMIEAQGDFNRPWLVESLASEYLPSISDVDEKLREGGRVVDMACGVGWAAISIAKGYPAVTVDGFDPDAGSIARAERLAEENGVADRVTFEARDGAEAPNPGSYDLAIVVESIHDMSHPVDVLRGLRTMLRPDGTLIVADEKVSDAFVAPAQDTERLFYGYSVLTCLPSGMADASSAATGTVMRRSTFEGYAREAGFDRVDVLPIEHDFLRFYRLDA